MTEASTTQAALHGPVVATAALVVALAVLLFRLLTTRGALDGGFAWTATGAIAIGITGIVFLFRNARQA